MKKYTDLPYLVALDEVAGAPGTYRAGKFLTAADLPAHAAEENAALQDRAPRRRTDEPVVPNGSLGHRFGDDGAGRWNLDLEDVEPRLLRLRAPDAETVEVTLPRFDDVDGTPGRACPATCRSRRVGDQLVTTVFDLMLAQYGVGRDGLGGNYARRRTTTRPRRTPRPGRSRSPASRHGRRADRPRVRAERRGVRRPVDDPDGRRHQPLVPLRHDLPRASSRSTTLTGCQGVNGGGWAHYVGQEKCRPVTGWAQLASAWTGAGRRGR